MKYEIIYILFIIFSFSCSRNHKLIYPLNTEKIEKNIYIDEFPVTNEEYRNFLNSVSQKWTLEYSNFLKTLPRYGLILEENELNQQNFSVKGKTIWYGYISESNNNVLNEFKLPLDSIVFNQEKLDTYFNHFVYSDYPAIYITRKSAELYCKWKADMENLKIALETNDSTDYKLYCAPISSRLPTKAEWTNAYNKSLKNKAIKENKYYSSRFTPIYNKHKLYNKKNDYHFYSQASKINEMLHDSLIIGSHIADSIISDSIIIQEYTIPNKNLGFRCVCEIGSERKKN